MGFYGIPYSTDGKLMIDVQVNKWVGETYIFKVDQRTPQQLFCQGKKSLLIDVNGSNLNG